ncbi:MAG: hypothetical protein ACLPUT_02755 [Solirubrobacteraceae bacterium]|jgi:hypothetical protein
MPDQEPVVSDQDEWLEEPEELPRRPRRRLLGTGGNPIILALLAVLLIACGFIGGVLVEKGETSSGSAAGSGSAASLASRFRALRGGTSSTSASGSAGAGFTRPTAGTVAYIAGSTLYVTNSEGNTVKVTTSAGTSVTKTVTASVKGIHPGETVTITGTTGSGGAVSAESISVGSSAGGLAALFGGSSASSSATGKAGGSSEPSLFGSGG